MAVFKKMMKVFAAGAFSMCAMLGSAVAAGEWPSRPVNIVVAFAPGGATDIVGRILATELGAAFKQSFVVTNRPGAGGQVGTEFVATQSNDGYTLLVSATGHVMAPSIQKSVKYHPTQSFEPISLLITMPNLLVVTPDLPVKTLPEFVNWARNQKNVSFGSAGTGGSSHLSGELLRHVSGLPLSHVGYRGMGPALTDVMSGHLPAMFVDTVSVGDLVTSGRVRAIAVTSSKRSIQYPDVAAISELGYPDFDLVNWVGLYAPAGTSAEIVARLNKEVVRIMGSPAVQERMRKLGADSNNQLDARQFRKYVEDEVVKWRKTIEATGVKIDQ